MIHYVKGDATNPQAAGRKVIAHIVNDLGKWDKGFVMAVSEKWPETREAYLYWVKYRRPESGVRFGIGFTQDPWGLGYNQTVLVQPHLAVTSMIAQRGIKGGSGGPPIRYEALEKCLLRLAVGAKQFNASVHMPRIGCGLAGGKWERVEPLIETLLCDAGVSVTVYDFE